MYKREGDEVKTLFRTNKDRLQQINEGIVEKISCIVLIYWGWAGDTYFEFEGVSCIMSLQGD